MDRGPGPGEVGPEKNFCTYFAGEGIDYRREDFRRADGASRILYLWDQSLDPQSYPDTGWGPPQGFARGIEFDREQINLALQAPTSQAAYRLVPSRDVSGHGTAVAGIAAGSRTQAYSGIAPQSELLVVKLGAPQAQGFPRTTQIMRAVAYAVKKAVSLGRPLAVNLSFGNSYGSHDGSSLLERFLDNAAEIGRTVICVGSGNEGDSAGHVAGNVESSRVVELAVGEYETSLSVQLWKDFSDRYRIRLRSPGGISLELPSLAEQGKYTLTLEGTQVLVYFGEPAPYSAAQEIYLELLPLRGSYIDSGVWQFEIDPVRVVTGEYYFYLPAQGARSLRTAFYNPTPDVTLTIPSTAAKVITVGACDASYEAYADFSGRGYVDPRRMVGVAPSGLTKPDLAAPGVGILAPDLYGGYQPVTGTSFATPIVTGSAALLMEWGIVRGQDPFLYGEKLKAYLRAGAKPIRGEEAYPNDRVGYGALCVADSIPGG